MAVKARCWMQWVVRLVDSLPSWRSSSFAVLKIWNCCCKFKVSGYGFSLYGFHDVVLDIFRRLVDRLWLVIHISSRLPLFGGGYGTVVVPEMAVNLLLIITVNGWCVGIR